MHAEPPRVRSVRSRWSASGATALLIALALAGLLVRLNLFETSIRALQPSSDESIAALLAVAIRDGATPLLFLAQPYLFPIESYLAAPFARLLTPDAMGARLPVFLLHLLTLAFQLALARRLFRERAPRLIAFALLLIPSAYVLMVQSLYSMPGYAFLLLAGFLMLLLAEGVGRTRVPAVRLALIGFLGGLGYGSHQLIAVFLIPVVLFVLVAALPVSTLRRSAWLGGGLAVGLVPYALARWRFPGAHAAAEQVLPLREIAERVWSPALTHTWPGALGWRLCLFPDESALPAAWSALDRCFGPALVALLLIGAARLLYERIRAPGQERARISLCDTLWLVALLNLLFFAAAGRATSASYRYLLPSAAVFPFLLADLAARFPRARLATGIAAALLALANFSNAPRLLEAWRAPDFAERVASIPDLRPAFDALKELGIRRAVASYGAAYRINWQSGGDVVCAQPYNERFPHWPHPFVEEVWSGEPIAYVLTERIRFLKPSVFERHLREEAVDAAVRTAGAFRVYFDFKPLNPPPQDRRLDPRAVRVEVSENPERAVFLQDRDLFTEWTTTNLMKGHERITVSWAEPRDIARVVLVHGLYHDDIPRSYALSASEWGPAFMVGARLDRFELDRGRPRYGRSTQTFDLGGRQTRSLLIEVAEPRTNRNWTIAEIEVYERVPDSNPDAMHE